jgi:pyruvate/2-oxoglutarate dehydrogenase complex dihydrolipoamide acyltransferase (E2) component
MTDSNLLEFRAEEFDERGCEPILLFWYVEEGDAVGEGQELCEIESAKAAFVLTSPAAGTLAEICVHETEPVGSGQLLGRIRTGGG